MVLEKEFSFWQSLKPDAQDALRVLSIHVGWCPVIGRIVIVSPCVPWAELFRLVVKTEHPFAVVVA